MGLDRLRKLIESLDRIIVFGDGGELFPPFVRQTLLAPLPPDSVDDQPVGNPE